MCGIIVGVNASLDQNKSLELIQHRGPDDKGWFESGPVQLGHVRLSIQDVSENGHQPFIDDSGDFILVFNGEIYNHWEIRQELIEKGYKGFKSSSDTETILYGFIAYGVELFDKLNGIFAAAFLNKRTNQLILARDRFGVKPLYYQFDNEQFVACSEIKGIISNVPEKSLNYHSLHNYLRFLWNPGSASPIHEINKLLPGHYAICDLSGDQPKLETHRFADSVYEGKVNSASEQEQVDELDRLLTKAMERQLLSDVPVGYFLSGGLDSSLLVALGKKLRPDQNIETFSIDTSDFAREGVSNDLFYARKVADHLKVNLNVVDGNIDIMSDFDEMIWYLDEPQADAAPLNVARICELAKQKDFKVLISGAGGDDIFSGYRRHQMLKYEGFINGIPKPLWNLLDFTSKKLLNSKSPKIRQLKKVINTASSAHRLNGMGYFEWFDHHEISSLFSDKIKAQIDFDKRRFEYFEEILSRIPNEPSKLNRMLFLEQNTFLVDHNLNYTDKMGMAQGLEIRVPYLDNDLVDFSYGIPTELKLKKGEAKYILKKVAERYLPMEVIYRPKAGFGLPIRQWIVEDLDPKIEIVTKKMVEREYGDIFNTESLKSLISRNKKGEIDASYTIWAILALESWIRQFMNDQ